MYLREIISLLAWPISVYLAYRVILWANAHMERKHPRAFKSPQVKQSK